VAAFRIDRRARRVLSLLLQLQELPPAGMLALELLLVALAAFGDYFTSADAAFTLAYLVPVTLAAWTGGFGAGTAMALISAAVLLGVDFWTHEHATNPKLYAWNLFMESATFLLVAYLTAGVRHILASERKAARTDHLTGLANRRLFWERASAELARARRYRHPVSMAYIDIDDFKRVNDRLGHATGDEVLQALGNALRKCTRATDIPVRMGGDEFGLMLPEAPATALKATLDKIRSGFMDRARRRRWPVTLSIGGVTFARAPSSIDEMLSRADRLLYAVKRAGKNSTRLDALD